MTKRQVKRVVRVKRPEGKPPHVPTDKDRGVVESMIAVGIGQLDIARVIGISHVTLRKHYRREIMTGATKANAQVGRTWFQRATGGGTWQNASDTSLIWWTKTRMGAKEPKQEVVIGGDKDNPLRTINSTMTPKEAAEIYALTLNDGNG